MAQVKKTEVRDAILAAAFDLFCRKGYSATTMAEIARVAGTTVSNLYIYFDSKLTVLYEINTPWLLRQIHTLAEQVQKFRTPETRLRRIFLGIWRDIPQADHSFANAMIEALADANDHRLAAAGAQAHCGKQIAVAHHMDGVRRIRHQSTHWRYT